MFQLDYNRAIREGSVGAVGAIPGTVASFPLDFIKVHQQSHPTPLSLRKAVDFLSLKSIIRGCGPAVSQKIATRAPMFLCSSLAVQASESIGFDPLPAAFIGSALSGYVTGSFAAVFEWRKVVTATSPASATTKFGSTYAFVKSAPSAMSVMRRMHFAGTRNAIFDSCFFFSLKLLIEKTDLRGATTYGIAAATAVVLDYAVDVAVKRCMREKPWEIDPRVKAKIGGVARATIGICLNEGLGVFRGLGAKVAEFSVSYVVTGLCAFQVMAAVDTILK